MWDSSGSLRIRLIETKILSLRFVSATANRELVEVLSGGNYSEKSCLWRDGEP